MKLYEILVQLFEGKIEFLTTKFGTQLQSRLDGDHTADLSVDEFMDKISKLDPSKKYLEWILKSYIKNDIKFEDLYKLEADLELFTKSKKDKSLEKTDINQYTPRSLVKAITTITTQRADTEHHMRTEGADVVIDGPDATILELKTEEAACYYGKDTRWCTAWLGDNNQFDKYNDEAPIYVALCKDGRKFQFHIGEEFQFMDEQDDPIEDLPSLRVKYPSINKLFSDIYEPSALKTPRSAYIFALKVIKGRWPEAEDVILKDPQTVYDYTKRTIKGRWPEAEDVIIKDPEAAAWYAVNAIKGRWPEAESVIIKDPEAAYMYTAQVIKGRWPEAEDVIMTNPQNAVYYSINMIKGRWPEAESVIMTHPYAAYVYAAIIIKGRWPEAEDVIMSNPMVAQEYKQQFDILNKR